MPTEQTRTVPNLLLAAFVLAAWGCSQSNQYQPPPPPDVTVAKPVQQDVINYLEETGTTEAVERVESSARVRGFLNRISFQPNEIVAADDVLFEIEKQEYEAIVAARKATMSAGQVELKKAQIEYDRQKKLAAEDATAETNVVAAEAARDGATASIQLAQADLDSAQIDLNYTTVKSPIAGRVGKTEVKIGNLVGDGEATHLTTVIKYDPIYANFNISERDLLQLRADSQRNGDGDLAKDGEELEELKKSLKLELRRATDEGFPFQGHLDYWDLTVNQGTGTYALRGIFPNPDLDIVPGLFVRVRIPLGKTENALLLPELAVLSDQQGRYVLVVNSENVVERRNVKVGTKVENMLVITEGLQPDDLVIVEGLQRARPQAPVTPTEKPLTAPQTQAVAVKQGSPPLETSPEGQDPSDSATAPPAPAPTDETPSPTPPGDSPQPTERSDS